MNVFHTSPRPITENGVNTMAQPFPIDNTEPEIGSLQIIERIETLEAERKELGETVTETVTDLDEDIERYDKEIAGLLDDDARANADAVERLKTERDEFAEFRDKQAQDLKDWEETEGKELKALRELADDAEPDSEEWTYGAKLVRHDCFLQHAKDLAEELYSSVDFDDWPFFHIDWDQAAERLKRRYVTVDFDGVTYYIRKTRK